MGDECSFVRARDGTRIAWRADGPATALPLLLCSMGTAATSIWDGAVLALSDRIRVIRYDRRGDGDSDPGAPESHTLDTYLQDALLVMAASDCGAAMVCGMALGARVATRLALAAPERVQRLLLFDATAGPPASEALRRAGAAEALRLRDAAGLPRVTIEPRWFERRDPAGAGLSRLALAQHPDWTPDLARIQAPTLVACGDHDPNLEGARRMAREIPNATFRLMPMTGHASLLDRPELVLTLIGAFLDIAAVAAPMMQPAQLRRTP